MSNPQGHNGASLGLSIGATNLAGTCGGQQPVVQPSSLTLGAGQVLTGFVDRVGDPVPMVAPDGTKHRSETLLAEALDNMARATAKGAPISETAATVPAHWPRPVVDALRAALRQKPGLSRSPLVSDATAAVTALRSNPGLPSAGVIALCDFGGSGTSITLVDAGSQYALIGETVRFPDFSGDQIDQAILTKVMAGMS
jgi:molecular chaperone DnaK (HSP70)